MQSSMTHDHQKERRCRWPLSGSPMAMHRPDGDAPAGQPGVRRLLTGGITETQMTDRSLGQQDLQPLTDEGEQTVIIRHFLQVGRVTEGSQILRQIPLLKHVQSSLIQTVRIVH
jgi:hypothetical protein